MTGLQRINAALEGLRASGCTRDASTGYWMDRTGAVLAADPLESWRLLRKSEVRQYINAKRAAGEAFTR